MGQMIRDALLFAALPFLALAAVAITMNWPWLWLVLIVGWLAFVTLLYAILVPAQRRYDRKVLGARPLTPAADPVAPPAAPSLPAPQPMPPAIGYQWRA